MTKKLISILLIDDNPDDNFFHKREIKKFDPDIAVVSKTSGMAALEFLQSKSADHIKPDLIFLDINMQV